MSGWSRNKQLQKSAKVWVCPIHGVICKEGEEKLIVQHKAKYGCYTQRIRLEYQFTENDIEELCRP